MVGFQGVKTESFALRAHNVDDHRRRVLTAVRAIVVAASKPEVHLSVPALADATGMSEQVIEELLRSEEYLQVLDETAKHRVATVLQKAITKLEDLVDNDDAKTALEAIRGATTLYRTLNQVNAGQRQAQSRADIDLIFKDLEMMGQLKQGQVKVVPNP